MMRTKIVATLGPSVRSLDRIEAILKEGVDVARVNFSHGDHEEHGKAMRDIRAKAAELGLPVAILQDLSGPKIRTGRLKGGAPVELVTGRTLRLTIKEIEGDAERVSVNYPRLCGDCRKGDRILLSDGAIELRVTEVGASEVVTEIVDGGTLGERKGVNLPGVRVSIPALTKKDDEDLAFGLSQDVDYVALSFVRGPDDIKLLRNRMAMLDHTAPIIAKIEKPEAIERLDDILNECDGVMVARGDLGVEMSPADVPILQKQIISECRSRGLPVITATQMLESMTENPRPTRAEAADVANAIFDGTDAIMLSGETSVGKFPVEAVKMMALIAVRAEAEMRRRGPFYASTRQLCPMIAPDCAKDAVPIEMATADAACAAAQAVGASLVAAFTLTGATATHLSQRRPQVPVVAFTPREDTYRRLCLRYGVRPMMIPTFESTDQMILQGEGLLLQNGLAEKGDVIVCVAGASTNTAGGTNMLKLHRLGQ
ncbi:MAG TPA: pyruvate kinase [Candidatus Brocadiia bacterium]|nr:pyruvate kinase [Candidatus Brocadiia bacterium]